MPTYVFRDTNTDEIFERFISISNKEAFMKENPHIQQIITPTALVTMSGSLDGKTDNTWKEVLSKISEQNPSSPLADRYGKKTIKEVKTKEIIHKHQKIQKERKSVKR